MLAIVTSVALCIAGVLYPLTYRLELAIDPNGQQRILIVPVDADGETPNAVAAPLFPQWWPSWAAIPVPAIPYPKR